MQPVKILYHPYQFRSGPFKYIEQGYLNGFRQTGCTVAVWDGADSRQLRGILDDFRPQLFIGYLRRSGDYQNFAWLSNECFDMLRAYRRSTGMKVALHAHPDVRRLSAHLNLHFTENDSSHADRFYQQPPPPSPQEEVLAGEGFIDLILHPYSRVLTKLCFAYWLQQGLPVMEEPLAADTATYSKPYLPRLKRYAISYIGGWWPFKGQQLDRFLLPLKQHFNKELAVFGNGWPYSSEGFVSDRRYKQIVWMSKVNLVFHEPSQVQGLAVHVNERIFKLYALGAFAICDNNPCLREYFDEDALVICAEPEEMVAQCSYYLRHPAERRRIAAKGYQTVLQRHTYRDRARALLSALAQRS